MPAETYWKLIERTGEQCYYLWGPIRNALLMELYEGNTELIASICIDGPLTNDRRMPADRKDMLIQVLTVAGREREDQVRQFLWRLTQQDSRWPWSARSCACVEVKKMVARVVGQLQVEDILQELMLDANEDVRRTAVRSAFHLWQDEKESSKSRDQLLTIAMLKQLGDPSKLSRWVFPSRRRLQSCFELSLSILFDDYSSSRTVAILQTLWAGILERVLWLRTRPEDGRFLLPGQILKMSRSMVLRLGTKLAVLMAKSLEEERMSVYDLREIELFFRSDAEIRETFRRLVPYIRSDAGDLDAVRDDLKRLASSRDVLCCYLLVLILCSHVLSRPDRTKAIIREIFEDVIEVRPGLPSIPMLIIALSNESDGRDGDEIDPDTLELEEEIIVRYQRQHDSTSVGRTGVRFIYSGLSSYPQYLYRKYGEVNRGVLHAFIDNARTEDGSYDRKIIYNYMVNVAVPGHPQYRDIGAILSCMEPVLRIAIPDDGLQEDLVDALARIRVYAPDKVDQFMDQQGVDGAIQDRVRNRSSEGEMASAVIGRGIFFVRDSILLEPDGPLAQIFLAWFERAPNCRDLAEWVDVLIRMVLNALSRAELSRT